MCYLITRRSRRRITMKDARAYPKMRKEIITKWIKTLLFNGNAEIILQLVFVKYKMPHQTNIFEADE